MASKIHVNLSPEHLRSIAATNRPLAALAEVIWNGLDADAKRVTVRFDRNSLDTLEDIRVSDNGSGIDYDCAEELFGKLGDSWKKKKLRTDSGRGLHGRDGKGRFRAFGLGGSVTWTTTCSRNGTGLITYKIRGSSIALDDFEVSDPTEAQPGVATGTEVVIGNLHKEFGSLTTEDAVLAATREFASYLTKHPGVLVDYDGSILDPKTAQARAADLTCDEVVLSSGKRVIPVLRVVEWKQPVERSLHLCDEEGVSRHELKLGTAVRAPGFTFTAYLMSEAVRDLAAENKLILEDVHPDVDALLVSAKRALKAYFRKRESEDLSQAVHRWKEENIYPYAEKAELTPVESAERQVFDIIAINVQEYLPDFEQFAHPSKRLTFQLLSQALKDNPESVQKIVSDVLGLKKEAQDDLAALLKKTPLSQIIQSAKIVANRLDFLVGLDALIFDEKSGEALLERDQLHKILEKESWLFHEEFALAGSEQKLEEVLQIHLDLLGKRTDDDAAVLLPDGKRGRVDLMLSKAIQPRTGEFDYMVVELKRPSKKIDAEVLTQVEKYAVAVAEDARFNGTQSRWRFIAISKEMDDYAKRKANQRGRPRGLVFDDASLNIEVWAKTWAETIGDARARLRFFSDQLSYEADRDSAKCYLKTAHEKFLPTVAEIVQEAPAKPSSP